MPSTMIKPSGQITQNGIGGLCESFINNTGTSVCGTLVIASSVLPNAVDIYESDPQSWMRNKVIGVICENGVPNGCPVKVTTIGKAYVLLQNGKGVNMGEVVTASPTAGNNGRAFPYADPYTLSFESQIGRALETKASGTDVLALIQLRFG